MATSFEKSVKGGTKIKLAAPKSKYVEHILVATHAGESGVAEIFRALQNRMRDSTWTIVFKSLIIVHLMIREGEPEVTLKYLAENPRKLAISNFTDVQMQGRNIRHYMQYLLERARTYRETKIDYVRGGEGRLKRLSVDKGLLRETESVQSQVHALLKCDVLSNEPENEITLTAFRLLTMDLLVLFHVINEGTINVLEYAKQKRAEHYFEMSKPDAERALVIYKIFSKQTNQVVEFLGIARQYENATRLEIPKLKHAPTGLTASLEEYLNDPDFEINRRQYLVQQEAKKSGKNTNGTSKPFGESKSIQSKPTIDKSFPSPNFTSAAPAAPAKPEARGPAPDLIDFFASIEQNQQPMAHEVSQQQQQMAAFRQAPTFLQQQPQQQIFSPIATGSQQSFDPSFNQQNQAHSYEPPQQQQQTLPQNYTGAGFGGYTAESPSIFSPQQSSLSSIPQDNIPNFPQPSHQQQHGSMDNQSQQLQPQPTNPFRQSMMSNPTGTLSQSFSASPPISAPISRQPTNPFARSVPPQSSVPDQNSPFTSSPPIQMQPPPQQTQQNPAVHSLRSSMTGTNPFARNASPVEQQQPPPQASAPQGAIVPNPTGSTNPFRQSAFHNQQTGQGWQSGQGTLGGLEQMDTVPVFPRPGQSPQVQGQQQGW
ncbi:MAG: hypothetical protein M1827_002004 [Pycnora praestabilis]|nr:MAG: hypothetical protein M1827_002004 [Pycnora praestabilis]